MIIARSVWRKVILTAVAACSFASLYEVTALDSKYAALQGRHIDIYMWSCNEALAFGRRPAHLNVLRLGWSPRSTTPSFLDRFFKRSAPLPLAARPLLQAMPADRGSQN